MAHATSLATLLKRCLSAFLNNNNNRKMRPDSAIKIFLCPHRKLLGECIYAHTQRETGALSTAHLHCGFNCQGNPKSGSKRAKCAGHSHRALGARRWLCPAYKDNENNLTTLSTIPWHWLVCPAACYWPNSGRCTLRALTNRETFFHLPVLLAFLHFFFRCIPCNHCKWVTGVVYTGLFVRI